ncbi:MAG TPA: hypothetical protein VEA37_03105, partial [Flavobacterium sp.]|nr:hypothetical protein [Flavobacterium sp.]
MRFALLLFLFMMSCHEKKIYMQPGLLGNNIYNPTSYPGSKNYFLDPIDDTISFKKITAYGDGYTLYKGIDGKTYLTYINQIKQKDNITTDFEYLEDKPYIDADTYKDIDNDFFVSNNKVWYWFWGDNGYYPVEVQNADTKTFVSNNSFPASGSDACHQFIYCDFEGFR